MNTKYYYAIRFLGGNRTCTWGKPHPTTGRYDIACAIEAFKTKAARTDWLNDENYSGSGSGGERIAVNKSDLKKYRRGTSAAEFADELDCVHGEAS